MQASGGEFKDIMFKVRTKDEEKINDRIATMPRLRLHAVVGSYLQLSSFQLHLYNIFRTSENSNISPNVPSMP